MSVPVLPLAGTPAPARPDARRRPWSRALGLALLVLYLPTGLPFLLGPLTECDHCIGAYLSWLPVVPSSFLGIHVGLSMGDSDGLSAIVVLVAITLLAFVLALTLARRRGRWSALGLVALALLNGLQALGFSVLLRM